MKKKIALLAFVFASSFLFNNVIAQAVNVSDSLALVDLYNSTNGPNWNYHTHWLTGRVSTWYGVTVTGTRVTQLDFYNNNLVGTLPSSIGNLSALTFLFMAFNQITGDIPSSIGNLTGLTSLILSGNPFTGSLPVSIGNLTNLTALGLNSDSLRDTIPASIGNLTNVTDLEMYGNKFTGRIPASIGNLTKLNLLILGTNQLSDSIPSSLGNLAVLDWLDLSYNKLSGPIPASLFTLALAEEMDLNSNQLTGSLPSNLGSLTNMSYLLLNNNQLTGLIPSSIGNLQRLHGFYINNNKISGHIPSSMGNALGLNEFVADYNQLSGGIPASFGNIPELDKLTISHNHFSFATNVNVPQLYKPDFTGDFSYNNFTFNGLEFVATKLPATDYSPQAKISVHLTGNTLSVSAGGTLSNNTYRWYKVGSTDSTVIAGDSTFQPVQSGQYFARITNSVATQLKLRTDTVSYTALLMKTFVSISPNPARGMIVIHGLNEKSDARITVADMSGYVWLRALSRQQSAIKVDVSRLKAGNYLLNVNDGKEVKTVEFVKE